MPQKSRLVKVFDELMPDALKEEKTRDYIKGPLPLKDSTKLLEEIVKVALDPTSDIVFSHQEGDCLFAEWTDKSGEKKSINLTNVLADEPNFEHINFLEESDKNRHFENYVEFMKKTGEFKPESLEPTYYKKREDKAKLDNPIIHIAEKMAINIYTGNKYKLINEFLRGNGKKWLPTLKDLSHKELQIRVRDVLFVTTMASHGIKRMPDLIEKPCGSIRYEDYEFKRDALKQKAAEGLTAIESNKTVKPKSFYSSSDANENQFCLLSNSVFTYVQQDSTSNKIGKSIAVYSQYGDEENEVLFMPGTKFSYLAHTEKNLSHFFIVRAIGGLGVAEKEKEQPSQMVKTESPKPKEKLQPASLFSSVNTFNLGVTAVAATAIIGITLSKNK